MKYNGYEVLENEKGIVIRGVKDFNLLHIFECGQCFRWIRQGDDSYTGVVQGRVVNVRYENECLWMDNTHLEDFSSLWFDYFDLGRDYQAIKALISKDDIMKKAVEYGHGIRLLRQELFETLLSFIISSNNKIPRIRSIISGLSEAYGEPISYQSQYYYTFPTVEALSRSSVEALSVCRGGYRCKYIVHTAKMLNDKVVSLEGLGQMCLADARNLLNQLSGVGNKVADCTLLFSGMRQNVFPTDVWIKRVMEVLYFKREATMREIQDFAREYFGDLAGFAQQYLFFYARAHHIGS